jgi:DNA replicative helicase MCM subunit Mcm2 (Cdc46/Mcm family)
MSTKLKFIREKFKNFLINFCDESMQFIYREKLKNLVISNRKTLNIFLEDIEMFDKRLFKSVYYQPFGCLKLFEFFLLNLTHNISQLKQTKKCKLENFQIFLVSRKNFKINSSMINDGIGKLISFKIYLNKLGKNKFSVKNYTDNFSEIINKSSSFWSDNNSDEITFEKYSFYDCQLANAHILDETFYTNKVTKEEILVFKRNLVGYLQEGDLAQITGFYRKDVFSENYSEKNKKKMCFEVLGVYRLNSHTQVLSIKPKILFDNKFLSFANSKKIYEWIFSSILIDTNNLEPIKRGLACQLFGSSTKKNNKLLDKKFINILILFKNEEIFTHFFNFLKDLSNTSTSLISMKDFISENFDFVDFNLISKQILDSKIFLDFGGSGIIYLENFNIINSQGKELLYEIIENTKKRTFRIKNNLIINSNFSLLVGIKIKGKISENIFLKTLSTKEIKLFDLVYTIHDSDIGELNCRTINKTLKYFIDQKEETLEKELSIKKQYSFLLNNFLKIAKNNFFPVITVKASKILENAYLLMKIEERKNISFFKKKYVFISIKNLETLVKISEALAKMRFSNSVNSDDAFEAIKILKEGMLGVI